MVFPVLERADSCSGFEQPGKRADRRITGHVADQFNGVGRVYQQIFGLGDPELSNVIIDCHAENFIKDMIECSPADRKLPGKLRAVQVFRVVFPDIFRDLGNKGRVLTIERSSGNAVLFVVQLIGDQEKLAKKKLQMKICPIFHRFFFQERRC